MISSMGGDRPATDMETFVYHVKAHKHELVRMARWLMKSKEEHNEWMGGDLSWADFLAQPEVGFTVREANSLIKLYDWLYGSNIPFEDINLATARFCAMKGIVDPELVEDMKVLSLKDFKENHYDATVEDSGKRTYTYMVMKRSNETGNLSKVYGDELEEAKNNL